MEDLPENLEEFWVFDYEGKLAEHKQTVSKSEEVFRLAHELLLYTNQVSADSLRRLSGTVPLTQPPTAATSGWSPSTPSAS